MTRACAVFDGWNGYQTSLVHVVEPLSGLAKGDTESLIDESVVELSAEHAGNASHVYARILAKAIQKHVMLDDLHLSDVLIALRNAGYAVDRKKGMLQKVKNAKREVA